MKRTILIIAAVISVTLLANCSDTPQQPIAPTEIEVNETGDDPHLGNLNTVNDEANITPPKQVIDVDTIVDSDNIELDAKLGTPIEVIHGNTIHGITFETRTYQLLDGSEIWFQLINNEIAVTAIHYQHGYTTSIQAITASGFKENQVELVEHIPQKVTNGVITSPQDIYSAITDTRKYEHISVAQNSKSLWNNIVIREKITIQGR